MKLNIHYLTYPLLVIVAVFAIYFSGQYHQRKTDQAKARADSAQAHAAAVVAAKAKADSLANDSIAKLQNKVVKTKQVSIGLEKQRDSLAKQVKTAKDTAQLVVTLKAQVVVDDSLIKSKDSTITAQGNQILFLAGQVVRDSVDYYKLAALNSNTNEKLAKAQADSHPGLLKRVASNLDIIGATVIITHFLVK